MMKTPQDKYRERAAKAWNRRDLKILREYLDALEETAGRALPKDPAAAYDILERRLAGLKKGILEKRDRAKELHNRDFFGSSDD